MDHLDFNEDAIDDAPPRVTRRRLAGDDEMDITPMIDITFLLLIFFLVASTPDVQAAISLPEARHGKGVSQRNATIITVGDSGNESAPVFLSDGKVASARLDGDLASQHQRIVDAVREGVENDKPKTNVIIKADRNVKHRDVARVIRAVSEVEGVQVFLAVLDAT